MLNGIVSGKNNAGGVRIDIQSSRRPVIRWYISTFAMASEIIFVIFVSVPATLCAGRLFCFRCHPIIIDAKGVEAIAAGSAGKMNDQA